MKRVTVAITDEMLDEAAATCRIGPAYGEKANYTRNCIVANRLSAMGMYEINVYMNNYRAKFMGERYNVPLLYDATSLIHRFDQWVQKGDTKPLPCTISLDVPEDVKWNS